MRALVVVLFLIGCAAAAPAPAAPETNAPAPIVQTPTPPAIATFAIPPTPAAGSTASWPVPNLTPISATPPPIAITVNCAGAFAQGGVALCRTIPGATIRVDGVERGHADAQGWAVIGFDRDSPARSEVQFVGGQGEVATRSFDIMPRTFDVQRVDGLDPQTVTPTDPAILTRLAHDRDVKNIGFASRAGIEGWLDGFRWPVEGPISGSWGNQRVLNGVPKSPHYGVDIAMPTGTAIHAPASGVVSLAEPDLFLEGGLVLIDHGQGLISMYLHMSRIDVHAGDHIAQGDQIGLIGARGRATGPHLCWRMKWRDRNLDPSLAILGLANARAELASAR